MVKIKIFTEHEGAWSNSDEALLCLKTGSWRSERPVLDEMKCNSCGVCSLFCPTQCIVSRGDHFIPNFEFCKGCGICARECPEKAIRMLPEGAFRNGEP